MSIKKGVIRYNEVFKFLTNRFLSRYTRFSRERSMKKVVKLSNEEKMQDVEGNLTTHAVSFGAIIGIPCTRRGSLYRVRSGPN